MSAPDPFALGGRQDDPLVALWAEHGRICAQRDALPNDDEGDAECDRLGHELTRIEDQMDAMVPTTLAGLIALIQLSLFYDEIGGYADREVIKNMLTGAERLGHTA